MEADGFDPTEERDPAAEEPKAAPTEGQDEERLADEVTGELDD